MTLEQLKIGQLATIESVGGDGKLRQHFLDMGVLPGTEVMLIKYAPMGDPMEIQIHGYELTLRLADAREIHIKPSLKSGKQQFKNLNNIKENIVHPGLGEKDHYHVKKGEGALEKGTVLTFALAGNQNCGKTTLFNQLTGSNQHVGNFPGVTVDRKDGVIRGHSDTSVTDLPGIYSLSPYSKEEIVSRQFILQQKPKGIINIIDATNIDRNLYLTMQLMELNIPVVLALIMMDEVRGNGGTIDINRMEHMLGIPVVPISASKNEGIEELISHAIQVAKYQERPGRNDFCEKDDHDGAVHRCLHGIMHLIADYAQKADIPVRFAATKVIEGDNRIIKVLQMTKEEEETIERIVAQMEKERGLDRAAAIAEMRFTFIQKIIAQCVKKPGKSKERIRKE